MFQERERSQIQEERRDRDAYDDEEEEESDEDDFIVDDDGVPITTKRKQKRHIFKDAYVSY